MSEWMSFPIHEGIDVFLREQYNARALAWAKFQGKTAQMEPLSAAFALEADVSYIGPESPVFLKNKCLSTVDVTWNEPAKEINKRIDAALAKFGKKRVDFARAGGLYYAGPYANKQLVNWMKPGMVDALIANAFDLYRQQWWQDVGKETLLHAMWEECQGAIDALDIIPSDPDYYLLSGKPPNTGVGYSRKWRDRASLARAFKNGDPAVDYILRHDLELFRDGQQAIWDVWPYKTIIVDGYLGYTGSPNVSRSDVDITAITPLGDGRERWSMSSMVRGANITPVSPFSTRALMPRAAMRDLLGKYAPNGYYKPMTKEVFDVFLYPPITMPDADQSDHVCVDADWGFTWPPPYVEPRKDGWTYVTPHEIRKLGADQTLGLGSGNRGITGYITPEYSSGRRGTRFLYEIFADHNISHYSYAMGLHIKAASNGDDQAISLPADEVPYLYQTPLVPHLRTKGSQGNAVFRWGKQCIFDGPDHLIMFTIPRPLKTETSANAVMKHELEMGGSTIEVGESRTLQVAEHAALSAARTWEVCPEVFYVDSTPKDIVNMLKSSSYQEHLKDAVLAGLVDKHVSTLLEMGDDTDAFDWDA